MTQLDFFLATSPSNTPGTFPQLDKAISQYASRLIPTQGLDRAIEISIGAAYVLYLIAEHGTDFYNAVMDLIPDGQQLDDCDVFHNQEVLDDAAQD